MMRKFEYKLFNGQVDNDELNELGSNGWQLISHSVAIADNICRQYYVFMREILETTNRILNG
jgi:hypothetical protein